jgi:CheY-like chemotaxis protein
MDLAMPVMDGFVASRMLRQLPQTRSVPIVAVSAYVQDKVWCDRARAAGVDECLAKPLDFTRLKVLLSSISSDTFKATPDSARH